jgi:hypothetical protein
MGGSASSRREEKNYSGQNSSVNRSLSVEHALHNGAMQAALALYLTMGIPALLGTLLVANHVLDLYDRWHRLRERWVRRR